MKIKRPIIFDLTIIEIISLIVSILTIIMLVIQILYLRSVSRKAENTDKKVGLIVNKYQSLWNKE